MSFNFPTNFEFSTKDVEKFLKDLEKKSKLDFKSKIMFSSCLQNYKSVCNICDWKGISKENKNSLKHIISNKEFYESFNDIF